MTKRKKDRLRRWALLVNNLVTLRADRDAIEAEMRAVETALASEFGVKIPEVVGA
jgi:hypothetical protein